MLRKCLGLCVCLFCNCLGLLLIGLLVCLGSGRLRAVVGCCTVFAWWVLAMLLVLFPVCLCLKGRELLLYDVFLWSVVCVCLLVLLLCFVGLWYLFVALVICFLCGGLLCLLVLLLVCRVVGCLALVAGVFCSTEVGCFVMRVRLVVGYLVCGAVVCV